MAATKKRILRSGADQWRVSYYDDNGKRHRPCFGTYAEAEDFRKEIENQLRTNTYRSSSFTMTVEDLSGAFLDYCEGRMNAGRRMSKKNFVVYRGHFKNHILNPEFGIGGTKLSRLPTSAICEFRDRLLKSGVSISSTRKVLATLRAAFSFALKEKNWVAINPARGVEVIGTAYDGPKKIKAPTKEQLKAILAHAPEDLKLKVMFAAFTGLRASEQWGLKWGQVNLEAGLVHVVSRIDSYGIEGSTKSVAGVRDVPLSAPLVRLLKEHRLGSGYSEDTDFVFANRKGRHTSHDNLMKRAYIPLLEKVEKAEKVRIGVWELDAVDEMDEMVMKFVPSLKWHNLRHFAISTWIEQKLTPKTVQTYAGHSSIVITFNRYGHLFPSEDHKAAMDRIAGEFMK
jgi:integrase